MASLLRFAAIVICAFIVIGFLNFAVDESGRASAEQVQAIDPARAEQKREAKSSKVEEAINDVNDFFLAPFDDVTDSTNAWVRHLVPTALGLLLYGLGLMLVANYLPKQRRANSDWRTA
jgi:hypothetical protein